MTMVILGGNQHKAERIARDIVKNLTVMDIDFTIVACPWIIKEDERP